MRIVAALPLLVACQGSGETDPVAAPDLRINEVMASNQAAVEAPDGSFPDWFEIGHFGDEAVDLSGATLTDTPTYPDKFVFPSGSSIAPGEYLVLWADGDGLGEDTVPFKLSADGEALAMFGPDGTPWGAMEFGPQVTDVSWARTPDGGDSWASADASPGAPNP